MAQPSVPRYRRLVLAMKPESVYGTDVFAGTYAAADIIPMFNCNPEARIDEIPNLSMAGDIGRLPSVIGTEMAAVTFSMWIRGNSALFDDAPSRVVPEVDRPLRGCGFAGAFSVPNGSAFDKLTYTPTNTLESMTIYVVQEILGSATAPAIKLTGAFGTVEFSMRAGGVCEARFSFMGAFGGRADVTYVAGSPSTNPQYPTLKSAAFQIDTANYAPRIASVGLNMGITVSPIPSINASTGIAGFFISDRNPRLTIDPEADLVATYDWITKWRAGNQADLDFTLGTATLNKLKFTLSRAQTVRHGSQQRDGLTAWPTTLLATVQAGNDDIALEFS